MTVVHVPVDRVTGRLVRQHTEVQQRLVHRDGAPQIHGSGNNMKIKSKSGAVLGALIAAALVSASAASLGGLNSETLGAESDVVAGCDTNGILVDGVDVAERHEHF